jgi:hypothetical protein
VTSGHGGRSDAMIGQAMECVVPFTVHNGSATSMMMRAHASVAEAILETSGLLPHFGDI